MRKRSEIAHGRTTSFRGFAKQPFWFVDLIYAGGKTKTHYSSRLDAEHSPQNLDMPSTC